MRKLVIWLVIMMLVGGLLGIVSLSTDAENGSGDDGGVKSASRSKSGTTSHDPIYINGNSQFTSANGVSSGSGTENNPYIIENWGINASTASGIRIEKTDVYFIIRNCVIHSGGSNHDGFFLDGVSNGRIENCVVYNNWCGIKLGDISLASSSNNNIIIDNQIYNNSGGGILFGFASNNNVTSNRIYNNSGEGIYLIPYSDNNIITGNQIYNNSRGIELDFSSNNSITGNQIYNNSIEGILLDSSSNNNITNCAVYNNSWVGILLWSFSNNNTITNCTVYNNSRGIYLWGPSNNNTITNCTVYNNNDGICLDYFSNNTITNCAVYNNSYGIYLHYSSNNNQITYCNITDNTNYGVYIHLTDYPSNYNIFHYNNFINNAQNTYDPCINYWDDGTAGNYWSDYNGSDLDGDGIGDLPYNISGGNNRDNFPLIYSFELYKIDSDGDGYSDMMDVFPNNPNEWKDTDKDGMGDNSDAFPNDPSASKDTDGDGYPDEWNIGKNQTDSTAGLTLDAFPTDPAASKDSDGDGYPDEWNTGKKQTDSITGLRLDAFPNDPHEWKDSDDDGIGDNSDFLPNLNNNIFHAIIIIVAVVVLLCVSLGAIIGIHRTKKLRKKASETIAATQTTLEEARKLGLDTKEGDELLEKAKKEMEERR